MTNSPRVKKAGWGVIAMLAAAQFIMVLDTTVMNVSITQVAEDLNTTVVGLQTAITMYTLVMASFMLLGGKLGDRWGDKRTFTVVVPAHGPRSLTTAFSPRRSRRSSPAGPSSRGLGGRGSFRHSPCSPLPPTPAEICSRPIDTRRWNYA